MAQIYASTQPKGFKNHIEKVAIVGAGGQIGRPIAEALIKAGKHQVTALTREGSKNSMPAGATVVKVDYDVEDSLVIALRGHQALIVTMNVDAGASGTFKIIEAAAKAKIEWIFPNEFGVDMSDPAVLRDSIVGLRTAEVREAAQKQGFGDHWFGITCGFWHEFSLGGGPERFGFDMTKRSVCFFDEGTTKINTTTFPQVGLAVARLLSLKIWPEDAEDKSLHLSQFRGGQVFISSFKVSQQDMLDSVLRVTGTETKDWTVTKESSKKRYADGVKALQEGDIMGIGKALYARIFYPDGTGDYEKKHGLQNELLGLPKEDLDQATKESLAFHNESKGRQSLFGKD